MNRRSTVFSFVFLMVIIFTSCSNDMSGDFKMIEGTYYGEISSSGMGSDFGNNLEVTTVQTFPTKFTFYLVFLGSPEVIEIPGVEFVSNSNNGISFKGSDVDSDIEVEGSFQNDGFSGEIVVKLSNLIQKGTIKKR